MQRIVYLAGPITGLSYGGATEWRQYVADKLPDYIIPVSPMRGKQYLGNEKKIGLSYEQYPLSCQKGITSRDRHGVMSCDAVMINLLGAKTVSIGTMIEIGWADMLRKPIILVIENDNPHTHPIVKECAGFIVDNLDEAIHVVTAVLMTGVK
jgi:nucleoside 2-deoxyribosyltransferase